MDERSDWRCEVRSVTAERVRPLRERLLRPGQPPEALVYGGDDDADTLHAGAFSAEGALVGIASLARGAREGGAARSPWRLRGMGTVAEVRGRGVGRRLLSACVEHAQARGGDELWCNARVSAVGFYERMGLEVVSAPFELPEIGPHVVMVLPLSQR